MINVRCANLQCSVLFGVPDDIYEHARSNPKRILVCPNGHETVFLVSNEDRLREQVKSLKESLEHAERLRVANYKTAAYWKGIAHRKNKRRP